MFFLQKLLALFRPAAPPTERPTLTRRELQVAQCILQGYSNKEIAQELNISLATVKTHVHNLLHKYGASSRWELSDRLRALGLDGGAG